MRRALRPFDGAVRHPRVPPARRWARRGAADQKGALREALDRRAREGRQRARERPRRVPQLCGDGDGARHDSRGEPRAGGAHAARVHGAADVPRRAAEAADDDRAGEHADELYAAVRKGMGINDNTGENDE